jgi:hypothetical protein
MRRYGLRFLVAILTFGIGVALSLALGLFRVPDTKIASFEWSGRTSCSKKFRLARPAVPPVDIELSDPLRLLHFGTTPDSSRQAELRRQFLVENTSEKTVTGYLISGERIWKTTEKERHNFFDWSSNDLLKPGESRAFTIPPHAEGLSLRVIKVTFQDGSTWTNPRPTR